MDGPARLANEPADGFGTKALLKVGIVIVFLMIGIVDIEFNDIFSAKSFPCL